MSSDKEGTCRLCSESAVLRNSHIVPEFMYKSLYLERQMIGFKESREGIKETVHQKGLREYLLCDSCEGHLNKSYEHPNVAIWEALANRSELLGLAVAYETTQQGAESAKVTGVDYAKFKLLLLSILWRASVAKRREYSAVRLGPYENTLRQMLIDEAPGPPLLFPCILTLLKRPVRMISRPAMGKYLGHTTYQFILTNVVLWFFISNRTHELPMLTAAVQEDGSFEALFSEPEDVPIYNLTMQGLRDIKASILKRKR
jgi:hypothetical protein